MAPCNFSIPVHATGDEIATKARSAIMSAGGTFQGNGETGNFEVTTPLGAIRGTYFIRSTMMQVAITSKPFLVSCSLIEKQLRSYFAALA